ncbi:hypothetical protein EAO77_30950 [Streptomyces sp. t39]|nr:hypothetical protein EAO77_30950 [Streptomyces sp. t39]
MLVMRSSRVCTGRAVRGGGDGQTTASLHQASAGRDPFTGTSHSSSVVGVRVEIPSSASAGPDMSL